MAANAVTIDRPLDRAIRWTLYGFVAALPLSITATQFFVLVLGALVVVRAAITRRLGTTIGPAGWLILALLAWTILAAPFSANPAVAVPRLLKYWVWMTYFVALAALDRRETAIRAMKILAAVVGLVALIGIAQHFFGYAVPRWPAPPVKLWEKHGGYFHAMGYFDHHLTFGTSLALALLAITGLWLAAPERRTRLWLSASLALGFFALLWSYARSAWLGFLAGLLALGAMKGKKYLAAVVVGVFAVGVAAYQLSPTLAARMQRSVQSADNLERLYTWKTTLDMIADHPLLGIGPGAYRLMTPPYRAGYNIQWTASSHAHNSYLQIAAESGIPAGLLFTALMAYLLALGAIRQDELKEQATRRALVMGATAAMTAFAAASLLQHNAGDAEVNMMFQWLAAWLVFWSRTGRDGA
jgi:putative inorganic carbon (HCO3(-)) transporter